MDAMIVLLFVSLFISLCSYVYVRVVFKEYSKVQASCGMTGAEAAENLLHAKGVMNVGIQQVAGKLNDYYNPATNIIRLSEEVYDKNSVAAISVAMHEASHAVQCAEGYTPFRVRNAIVKSTNIASTISYWLVLAGLLFSSKNAGSVLGDGLLTAGIFFFLAVIFFQLVTLPVEFNASRKALQYMDESSVLTDEERAGAGKVLRAAALTYVAALTVSLLHLLRLVMIRGRRR